MAKITVPSSPRSMTRKCADALVAYIAGNYPDYTAYPHAWGNDWGVTVIGSFDPGELGMTLDTAIYLGLSY